jgi:aldehyde:ferredoxin oxidoreductase
MFEEIGEIYQAITGGEPQHLFASTERANLIEKSFNALLGLSRKDDKRQGAKRVPKDPMNEPGMLDEYYEFRGFSKDGIPTRKRLLELGLTDVVEDLEKKGALSDHECPAIEEQIA